MADPKNTTKQDTAAEKGAEDVSKKEPAALTAEAAAKAVKRIVHGKDADGEPTVKEVAIKPSEVFAFAQREDGTIVVVTVDGQKLLSA